MTESPEVLAARKEEQVKARLNAHDEDIRELRRAAAEDRAMTAQSFNSIKHQLTGVERAIGESAAAATAVAEAAKETASKTISTRSFYLGCAGVIATLIAIAGSTGHL